MQQFDTSWTECVGDISYTTFTKDSVSMCQLHKFRLSLKYEEDQRDFISNFVFSQSRQIYDNEGSYWSVIIIIVS